MVTKRTILVPSTQTIEVLKTEGERFIAVVLAIDSSLNPRTDTRPLAGMLRAMPRELWYVSWLEIAGIPEAIVAHRGIEGDELMDVYYIYDLEANGLDGVYNRKVPRLTHTVDIDLLIVNPELWERITQTKREGA